MKAKDIVTELEELERKRDEISTVLNEASFGEPQIILQSALDSYTKRVDTFLDSEFEPLATVIYIAATPTPLSLNVDGIAQLAVVATLSNGLTKDITAPDYPIMFFKDFDKLTNNTGVITSVSIAGYSGEDATFEVVKTSTGFDVDDNLNTQGLEIAVTINTNEFQIVDQAGISLGITFITDGAVVTGDNWLIDIYNVTSGTVYSTDNPGVANVDKYGLVIGIGGGIANIVVENGLQQVMVPITITDTIAPEPPTIFEVTAGEESANVTFDPSMDADVVTYNIYVDLVQSVTGVVYDGLTKTFTLTPADGIISYSITMTSVDGSGNESVQSNAVSVVPLPLA